MAKKIPLSQGKFAIVDDDMFDYLNQWKWCFDGRYAVRRATVEERKEGFPRTIMMHRFIMGIANGNPKIQVDHRNGNKLDNRRENLRICSHAENMMNRGKRKDNTSGYLGVAYHKQTEKFQARIYYDYKSYFLGLYTNPKEAAYAYDVAARILHGAFCRVNNVKLPKHKAQQIEAYVIRRLVKKGLINAA